jgi:hypothetical protein
MHSPSASMRATYPTHHILLQLIIIVLESWQDYLLSRMKYSVRFLSHSRRML